VKKEVVAFGGIGIDVDVIDDSGSGSDNSGDTTEIDDTPSPPTTVDDLDDIKLDPIEGTPSKIEDRVIWEPWGEEVSEDVLCNTEIQAVSGVKPICDSEDNPSITTLPSGHTIIAYEEREESGQNRIKLAILDTSVVNKIIYYRSLSRGTLINNDSDSNIITFEVFDSIVIEEYSNLKIGFLTGPLKGSNESQGPFTVNIITPSIDTDGKTKLLIEFDIGERSLYFPDSNNISDVIWFLSQSLPGDAGLDLSKCIKFTRSHRFIRNSCSGGKSVYYFKLK